MNIPLKVVTTMIIDKLDKGYLVTLRGEKFLNSRDGEPPEEKHAVASKEALGTLIAERL